MLIPGKSIYSIFLIFRLTMFGSDYALAGFGDEVIVFLAILGAVVAIIISYVFTAFQTSPVMSEPQESSAFEGKSMGLFGSLICVEIAEV